jgi:hypothetical protein
VWRNPIFTLLPLVVIATTGACTSGGDPGARVELPLPPTTESVRSLERPEGPAADLAGPLTAGDGIDLATAAAVPDLAAAGWVVEEYTAEGVATSYRSRGPLPTDGSYMLVEDMADRYRTRIVVRRPSDARDFNGTVVVEWLNVSGGVDADPNFAYTADEMVRGGYAWVGVSAQMVGVEGGPVAVSVAGGDDAAGAGLRRVDPERYGMLTHPGDAFSYDIYTQVARALREPDEINVLGELEPQRLLAVGESQSAFALTTYVNGVHPLTQVFDGFLIHSRGGAAAPLGKAHEPIDLAGTIGGPPTRIRPDLDIPVLVLETETDLLTILNYHPARQGDGPSFRLWEVAGAAHADAHLVGATSADVVCPSPVNAGPHHFVAKAALRGLDTWVRTGVRPPRAARLETDDTPDIVRSGDGIALGGIRTPLVDVPVATLSGEPTDTSSVICLLLGSTTTFDPARLAALYPTPEAYLLAYTQAADAAIAAGFVLPDDRAALLAAAQPGVIPSPAPAT